MIWPTIFFNDITIGVERPSTCLALGDEHEQRLYRIPCDVASRRVAPSLPAASILQFMGRGAPRQCVGAISSLSGTTQSELHAMLARRQGDTGSAHFGQRMIVDRRFLAAYYMTPSSAALLIGLACRKKLRQWFVGVSPKCSILIMQVAQAWLDSQQRISRCLSA